MAHQANFLDRQAEAGRGMALLRWVTCCRGKTAQHSPGDSCVRQEGLHPYLGSGGPNVGTHLKKRSVTWEVPTSNCPVKGLMLTFK